MSDNSQVHHVTSLGTIHQHQEACEECEKTGSQNERQDIGGDVYKTSRQVITFICSCWINSRYHKTLQLFIMLRLIVVLFCLLAAILVMTSAQIQGYPGGQNGGFNTANQNSFAPPNIPLLQYLLMQRYFD